ncbi:hypothetical protein MKW94_006130 [Papaver nudicaule]|uniref:Plant bHLH transcription factor ACT-like domain-containing protein n=1 Tax=Papaver nudicaule TaxID=74823 RepID=A0AA41RR98_PAPNU|nr:hypothetical protein [Papaver nudicaule]
MEVDEQGFLEELLSLRRETWETFPSQMSASTDEVMMLSNGWTYNCFNEMMITNDSSLDCLVPNPSMFGGEIDMSSAKSQLDFVSSFNAMNVPFEEDLSFMMPEIDNNFTFEQKQDASPPPLFIEQQQQIVPPSPSLSNNDQTQKLIEDENDTKLKQVHQASTNQVQVFEKGEIAQMGGSTNNPLDVFKDLKSKEVLIRNTPKFEVERREMDTRVEISCAGKPGLLLSTISAIEALGLEIQQCVISCFSDFAMQASCSEELEQTKIISSDEIKQALFISAGYGGRFL